MSKDKPEVGDVWLRPNGGKISVVRIINIHNKAWQAECLIQDDYSGDVGFCYSLVHLFDQEATYLGKSKANINDLFEVQDDKD